MLKKWEDRGDDDLSPYGHGVWDTMHAGILHNWHPYALNMWRELNLPAAIDCAVSIEDPRSCEHHAWLSCTTLVEISNINARKALGRTVVITSFLYRSFFFLSVFLSSIPQWRMGNRLWFGGKGCATEHIIGWMHTIIYYQTCLFSLSCQDSEQADVVVMRVYGEGERGKDTRDKEDDVFFLS